MTDSNGVAVRPENLAPHSVEAEEAVLGSILINPDALVDVAGFLKPSDFYILRNGYVYEAIVIVHERGDAVDNLTVIQELRDQGHLEAVGRSAYITHLMNNTPTHIHAETYARIVERAAIRRRLLAAASDIARTALEENAEISDVLDHAEATLFAVTSRRGGKDLVHIQVLSSAYFDGVEMRYESKVELAGLPTGFADLDKVLGGLAGGELVLVGARPGMGKTGLVLNVAQNVARQYRSRVAVFSMEMSYEELLNRLYAAETGINSKKLRIGALDEREWSLFTEATGRVSRWPIFIDDSADLNVLQMRSKCRRLQRQVGLDLVIVDYVQLLLSNRRSENRVQEVSEISRNLKLMAKELGVPVVAACQLSRKLEERKDKRPILSDLRESGSLEQDSDKVLFIYRDDMYNEATVSGPTRRTSSSPRTATGRQASPRCGSARNSPSSGTCCGLRLT
jgi:replicative DNA helicase